MATATLISDNKKVCKGIILDHVAMFSSHFRLPSAERNILYFPLLVLKGIHHYWKYCFPRGLKQMEINWPKR